MLKPVKIHIKKMVRVPTKHQIVHMWRTEWHKIGVIESKDSAKLFYRIGGGPIETDSQVAKMLLDEYGPGKYMMIFWKMGQRGFRTFIHVEVQEDYFKILRKKKTKFNKEIMTIGKITHELERRIKKGDISKSEIDDMKEEISEIKIGIRDEINWDKEIGANTEYTHSYLRFTPVKYKSHSYPINKKEFNRGNESGFW